MAGINKVMLIGNLGRDPEIRRFDNGSVARFSLATTENFRDRSGEWQSRTEWHNVVAWRALADKAERSLKKGSQIYVEGKLRTRSYDDKEGNKRYTTEVEAEYFTLLGGRPQDEQDNSGGYSGNTGAKPAESTSPPAADPLADDGGDDDLPF